MHGSPFPDLGRRLSCLSFLPRGLAHSLEHPCLLDRIIERVVRMPRLPLEFGRNLARPRVIPHAPAQAHVKGLDVDSTNAEGILTEILLEVKVDEGPVESRVKAHKYGLRVPCHLADPVPEGHEGVLR